MKVRMAEKFQNKYRIASARLQTWDYGWNAAYFVTICTQNKECFFGNIIDGKMHLSETGNIAQKFWIEIPNHFPFTRLGEFIIMPDHMHGIIIIDKFNNHQIVQTPNLGVSAMPDIPNLGVSAMPDIPNLGVSAMPDIPNLGVSAMPNIPNLGVSAMPDIPNLGVSSSAPGGKNEQWKPGTLGVIINQYKRICTINARKTHPNFAWQPRFHDIIIRNDRAFKTISKYIIRNPEKWQIPPN